MTAAQTKTVIVAGVLMFLAVFGLGGVALWWELSNWNNGATFSEVFWAMWAEQPGVIFILSHAAAAVFWSTVGHWVWQSSGVYDAIRKGTWFKVPPSAALAVLLLLTASATFAAEPAPPPLTFDTYTFTGSLIKPGTERLLIVGARAQAELQVAGPVRAFTRATASALADGGSDEVRFENPESFTSLEILWGARGRVFGDIDATAFWGLTVPMEGGRPALVERYPRTYGAGVIVHQLGGWGLLAIGAHEAAGPGLKVLFAGQLPLEGRLSAVADGAIGGASFLRFGVAVRLQ